jgi:uracil-DNA glycosylase
MGLKSQLGDWYEILRTEFSKEYMKELSKKLRIARLYADIYPAKDDVFRAYRLTSPKNLKILILGQDPFHTPNMANGLCFSVNEQINERIPPSLRNIFKEIESDIGFQPYHNPDLERWAKQGVMLLNTTLTVQRNMPNSHADWGWHNFTGKTIEHICNMDNPVLFMLFGRVAQQFAPMIPNHHGMIITAHPSPFSAYRGFFGTKPFSRANEWLINNNKQPIDWLKNE